MMRIPFDKYHVSGNDYLICAQTDWELPINTTYIKSLCDRCNGIGADGILFWSTSTEHKWSLRIYNSDGTECEKSANGLLIFAQYLKDNGLSQHRTIEIFLCKLAETIKVNEFADGCDSVQLGRYYFSSDKIPVRSNKETFIDQQVVIGDEKFNLNCVSLGNPHCVIFVDRELSMDEVINKGRLIGQSTLFPDKANVIFALIRSETLIKIEVWERGAGYIQSSGMCACAAAILSYTRKYTKNKVTIEMQGGEVTVMLNGRDEVSLSGKAELICSGDVAPHIIN
ncbi:diaminopimelate epimerase [Moritella marina ATCC 15381]|uniref:Diaminopimelate epimerase n=1 Tax=Moritella marina ATCC 15381 TaxID=1202962 RepID=A0A5J6WKS1_MORMI|nr:diaminopimelate epimerase [Moritella marina]QFI37022.1 diaminopimelate epimerase [Moritella marina ATCC 15381]